MTDERLTATFYRVRPTGGEGWGDIHIELSVWKKPRKRVAVCGADMAEGVAQRRDGALFRGWADVLCVDCTRVLERYA